MTNVEQNIDIMNYLVMVDNEKYKDVRISGDKMTFGKYTIPLDLINLKQIIESNENLRKDLYTMDVEDLFKILEINAITLQSALKTGNYKVYENNAKIVNKLKQTNEIMKNITVINKEDSFLTEQFFNIVDSQGRVHTFKNTNSIDISLVMYEFLEKSQGQNLDLLVDLISQKIPELKMTVSNNMNDNLEVSEDFKNKIKQVEEEFKDKPGMHIYGNEKEGIITIVDTLDPKNNETRTYKRDKDQNLVEEKYKDSEEFDKMATSKIEESKSEEMKEEDVNLTKEDDKEKDTSVDDIEKEEEEIELIPYDEFLQLINKEAELTEDEKEQVALWEQTLGDIFIYEEYLTEEIVGYLKQYEMDIERMEIFGKEYQLNKNQEEAIKKFYEITDISLRNEKLNNMGDERKNDTARKLTKQMDGLDRAGKLSLSLILTMLIISMGLIAYIVIALT